MISNPYRVEHGGPSSEARFALAHQSLLAQDQARREYLDSYCKAHKDEPWDCADRATQREMKRITRERRQELEQRILRALEEGMTNEQIALEQGVSIKTIWLYKKRLGKVNERKAKDPVRQGRPQGSC